MSNLQPAQYRHEEELKRLRRLIEGWAGRAKNIADALPPGYKDGLRELAAEMRKEVKG